MKTVSIPSDDKNLLIAIGNLSDSDFALFEKALAEVPARLSIEALYEHLRIAFKNETLSTRKTVVTLISMHATRISNNFSKEEFSKAVIKDLGREPPKDLEKRIVELLGIEPFIFLARAKEIQMECENTFIDSRTISDLRTVFDSDCTKAVGALIVHNLMIEYGNNNQRKKMFFSLDNEDLENLSKVIDRAKKKTEALKKHIGGDLKAVYYE